MSTNNFTIKYITSKKIVKRIDKICKLNDRKKLIKKTIKIPKVESKLLKYNA